MPSPTTDALRSRLPAGVSSMAGKVALAVLGSMALWISAKVQVPFYPVPMTMQSLVVLAIGMGFGARLGAATLALYLLEGAAGLPVFAGTPERGLGLAYMVGPTGGYLAGYLLAAVAVGWLADRGHGRTLRTSLPMALAGTLAIYAAGLLWLGASIGWDKPLLSLGLLPFLPGDVLKVVIAGLAAPAVFSLVRRHSPSGR